jgi:hypothetical protein
MNQAASKRLPWLDRWTQPSLEQLLQPLSDQQRSIAERLIEGMEKFEGVHWHFAWHGRAWKWTLQFDLYDAEGGFIGPIAYIVPNPETFEFCMPLKEQTIEQVNLKRLQRFVRDGLRAAKCAVTLHWAVFHPTAGTETEQLLDLVKRVHKVLYHQQYQQAQEAQAESEAE